MAKKEKIVRPLGKGGRLVREDGGPPVEVPRDWALLPPGDAALTRRVKAAGDYWAVKVRKGGREISRGIWAPKRHITTAKRSVAAMRADPAYEKKLAAGRARRAREQQDYVREFTRHVRHFLAFDERHVELEGLMAAAIAAHATPVGSGTVARTARIPVAERAEAAVIAWMRHQTTAYDRMSIPRVKGHRREVRRRLAARSRELLSRYRSDRAPAEDCLLAAALSKLAKAPATSDRPGAAREPLTRTNTKPTPAPRTTKVSARAARPAAADPIPTPSRVGPSERKRRAKAAEPQPSSTNDVLAEREKRQAALRAKFKRR